MRFDPSTAISGNTITFNAQDDPGYNDGEEVIYDNGVADGGVGSSINGLCATTEKTKSSPSCGVAKVSGEQAINMQTRVDGDNQSLAGTLKVRSTNGFGSSGKVTIAGIGGTCNYSVTDGTHLSISGCAGTPADGALVKTPSTLVVDSTSKFNSSNGSFTVEGISGVCTYSGTTATEFHNVSCAGLVGNNALVGGGLYYTKNVGPHQYRLYADPNLDDPGRDLRRQRREPPPRPDRQGRCLAGCLEPVRPREQST